MLFSGKRDSFEFSWRLELDKKKFFSYCVDKYSIPRVHKNRNKKSFAKRRHIKGENAIQSLKKIIQSWKISESLSFKFLIYPFGSEALQCSLKGGDIDVICLATGLDSKQFFSSFQRFLAKQKGVASCRTILARVPLIEFKLNGIDFDFLFCQIEGEELEERNFNEMPDKCIGEASQLSLNGLRNTQKIQSATAVNSANFKMAMFFF